MKLFGTTNSINSNAGFSKLFMSLKGLLTAKFEKLNQNNNFLKDFWSFEQVCFYENNHLLT